ncbi:MAG: SpoIIE family protein phosphatase [Deltaproteobacteria bacterium]|jgi:phosphoserine phosphatase RsbU/P
MSIEKILRRISLFDSVEVNALPELALSLESIRLDAGRILFYENDPGDCFYIVVEGNLEIIKAFGSTEERLLQNWGPGNFLGEMSMFDLEGRRSATVRARTPATLLKMNHASFRSLLYRQPDLAFEVTRQLSLRLRNNDNAIIHDLHEKNQQLAAAYTELAEAYKELQAAQVQIVEKERLERELQVAREIQESILPQTLPVIFGIDLGVMMRPARAVGGDLYDLIALKENCLGVVIGDVSDKGVPAAIFMALARSLLRAEASRMAPPAEVLREVNRHLLDMNTAGLFITVIYGVLECEHRRFTFVRAGHEIPFFFRKDGTEISPGNGHGQALGLFDDVVLEELSVTLPPGSRIVLYTDGATDTENPDNERFGRERLRESMRRHCLSSAQEFCEAIFETIAQFQDGAPQADDMAMVAIDMH